MRELCVNYAWARVWRPSGIESTLSRSTVFGAPMRNEHGRVKQGRNFQFFAIPDLLNVEAQKLIARSLFLERHCAVNMAEFSKGRIFSFSLFSAF